jgi:hemerythrin-like metal-binding protein
MGPVLKGLANYTIDHFATEERLMTTSGYPNYSRHKAKHDTLTKQVKDLLKEFDAGRLTLPTTLSKFLADWLTHHIREEDMELIHWVQEHKK